MKHIHTFPVDVSLTADEAWHELCLMGVRATNTGSTRWANIACDGEECQGIAESDDLRVVPTPPTSGSDPQQVPDV